MNLLLDTHVLLWALADDPELDAEARVAIIDPHNRVLVSAVSAWEIVIKANLGKLRAPDDLLVQLGQAGFEPLPVTVEHALAVGGLPDHHADPFDRLLVAQGRTEQLAIVTRDARIREYDVSTMPG